MAPKVTGAETQLEQRAWAAAQQRAAAVSGTQKRRDGVVHTPPQLARSVAGWVDRHLQTDRGLAGGLCDPRVFLIDPACGTGAFAAAALAQVGPRTTTPSGVWLADIDGGALEAAKTLLLSQPLAGWPVHFHHGDALAVEPARLLEGLPDGAVPVVLGNPPWSVAAARGPDAEVGNMLKDFQRLPDGTPLRERKLGVLRDRYVLFFRWALEVARVAPNGGVVCLVTNGSFIDGPVHRGMRGALVSWCDRLDVIDLGGNALLSRREGRDDNVFGVRPSVAVTLADCAPQVRAGRAGRAGRSRVGYLRVLGSTAEKASRLFQVASGQRKLDSASPQPPDYRLLRPPAGARRYAAFVSLAEAMPFHREGVQTNRDAAATADSCEALLARLRGFVAGAEGEALASANTPRQHYDPELARARVAQALALDPDGTRGLAVVPIAYRPGQVRYLCPVAPFCHRPRPALLAAMAKSQVALASVRKDRGTKTWRHVASVTHIADSSFLSARSSCRTRVFPSHAPGGDGTADENLDTGFAKALSERLGAPVTAVEFVAYALAVLSAPSFQGAFDESLRLDYPRLPWPDTAARFAALTTQGRLLFGPAGVSVSPEAARALDGLMAPQWFP